MPEGDIPRGGSQSQDVRVRQWRECVGWGRDMCARVVLLRAAIVAVHLSEGPVGGGHVSDVFGREHALERTWAVRCGETWWGQERRGGSMALEAGGRVAQRWQS